MTQVTQAPDRSRVRAQIAAKTLRKDDWWRYPSVNAIFLGIAVVYLTWASVVNTNYYAAPLISPLYSPCLATTCTSGAGFSWVPWLAGLTPAILIIWGPMGFRLTCYYYRKAYYRGFWQSPPACAVREPHAKYTGETRLPLILQNVHRYFFYVALIFNVILSVDAVFAFRNADGAWGHISVGTLVLIVNAALLWLYSVSCHSCRHVTGGRLKHFSKHPLRYKAWTIVSKLNARHAQFAWVSLGFVCFTDLYIRLVAAQVFPNLQFF
ncbi:MAG TPA: hypothetical protein VFQ44_25595 [Streptosporangiaceae bacterium]|nr:hypothetical protein [Streptosporangiaceae bacterium]